MKSLTLVLCVIAILGSAAATFFYFQIGDAKEQLQQQVSAAETRASDLQTKLTEAGSQNEALQRRLAALDSDLGQAKSQATTAETRTAQLNRDVAQLRNQITAKEDAEQTLNREISQLKRELAQSKLASASATPEEIEGYKQTIATLQTRISELEASRGTASGQPDTVAGGAQQAAPGSHFSAEVVSVGNQNGFVVLNAGTAKGVQTGQRVAITRGGNPVATAQISSVQNNYSIAQISADTLRGGLLKGDQAVPVQ